MKATAYETIAEAQHYAATLYPTKRFSLAAPVPNKLLHCALFRVADKRKPRVEHLTVEFNLSSGGRLIFTGKELRQAEGAVFAYLCHLSAGKGLNQWLPVNAREAVKTLGWSVTKHSIEKLKACLDNLCGATLRRVDENGNREGAAGLVSEWRSVGDDLLEVKQPESLMSLWQDFAHPTHLNLGNLGLLPEGLASWLYAFLCANDCSRGFSYEQIHALCGSDSTDPKQFAKDVRAALDKLKALGVLWGYETKRGEFTAGKNRH